MKTEGGIDSKRYGEREESSFRKPIELCESSRRKLMEMGSLKHDRMPVMMKRIIMI